MESGWSSSPRSAIPGAQVRQVAKTAPVRQADASRHLLSRRHVADESVDLVYLDPPFNSNATYNVLFGDHAGTRSAAQIKAFDDTWHWDQAAAEAPLKGVMGVLEDEWASSRILGDPHSSIVDLPLTAVQEELLSVAAWYDNEMGYATRLAETAARIAG